MNSIHPASKDNRNYCPECGKKIYRTECKHEYVPDHDDESKWHRNFNRLQEEKLKEDDE